MKKKALCLITIAFEFLKSAKQNMMLLNKPRVLTHFETWNSVAKSSKRKDQHVLQVRRAEHDLWLRVQQDPQVSAKYV